MANMAELSRRFAENAASSEDTIAGNGYIVPLIVDDKGPETNLLAVAHENGNLYKFATNAPRSLLKHLRDRSLAQPGAVHVVIDHTASVRYTGRTGKEFPIGSLRDFGGRAYDVTRSAIDIDTGERRRRRFLPVELMLEDEIGDTRVSTYGEAVAGHYVRAAGDEAVISKLNKIMTASWPTDFETDESGLELIGTSHIGAAFVEVVVRAMTGDSESVETSGETDPELEAELAALEAELAELGDDWSEEEGV